MYVIDYLAKSIKDPTTIDEQKLNGVIHVRVIGVDAEYADQI